MRRGGGTRVARPGSAAVVLSLQRALPASGPAAHTRDPAMPLVVGSSSESS